MDRIDRQLLAALINDGRATYQELGRLVRLSSNTVADRIRRLRKDGVIRGYRAELDFAVLGRDMQIITDIRLQDTVDTAEFERGLDAVPQVIEASRLTGEYNYQLRVVCANALELEGIIDLLKQRHGVRQAHSRLVLHTVPLRLDRILAP